VNVYNLSVVIKNYSSIAPLIRPASKWIHWVGFLRRWEAVESLFTGKSQLLQVFVDCASCTTWYSLVCAGDLSLVHVQTSEVSFLWVCSLCLSSSILNYSFVTLSLQRTSSIMLLCHLWCGVCVASQLPNLTESCCVVVSQWGPQGNAID